MKKWLLLFFLILFNTALQAEFAITDEGKAENLYSKALELEINDTKEKALIYYKDILIRYPQTQTAHAARKKVQALEPDTTGKDGETSRYKANTDGTVEDVITGLMWMRCAIGQQWNGSTCLGKPEKFTWNKIKEITRSHIGHEDWRLPTIEELRTLIYCSTGRPDYFSMGEDADISNKDYGCGGKASAIDHEIPTIVKAIFPNTPSEYYDSTFWSSSVNTEDSFYVWVAIFSGGYINAGGFHKNDKLNVRLVREVN